jgi:hypothetical protein
MNADDLKKLTTDSLDRLASLLEAGHSDELVTLLRTMARFHRYSLHNVCLISSQCPTATRVAGFQTWRALNRFVRRGEKGIVILAPIIRRRADGADEDSKHIAGFRAAYVFDVAQTDGEPLPSVAAASGDPGQRTTALRSAILARGIALDDLGDLGGALGTSAGGRIQIVKGLSPAEEFVVGEAIGLQVGNAARDYIHLYHGDRDGLLRSMDRVRAAAATIITAVDPAL